MFFRNNDSNNNPSPAPAAASGGFSFRANDAKKSIPSVLSQDFHVIGNIIYDGVIDLNGSVDGNVKCQTATIRTEGVVRGDVTAETVHVYGTVKGFIKAKNVHLYASCNVEGTIMHEALSIEDGAMVDGKFKRLSRVNLNHHEHEAPESSVQDEEMLPSNAPVSRPYDKIRLIKDEKKTEDVA